MVERYLNYLILVIMMVGGSKIFVLISFVSKRNIFIWSNALYKQYIVRYAPDSRVVVFGFNFTNHTFMRNNLKTEVRYHETET